MNCSLCNLETCQCCICLCNGKCVNCVGKLVASAIDHVYAAMTELKNGDVDIIKRTTVALTCLEDSQKDLFTLLKKLPPK